jgi:hypothetical protein
MLYHYTRIKNLKEILKTQRLQLTNISCFRDVYEYIYTVSLLYRKRSLSPVVERELQSELTQQNHLIFVGCFCGESDRPYLWKEYGDCSIEFAEQDLMAMVSYQALTLGHVTAHNGLLSCEYCEKRQMAIIGNALSQWEETGISGKEFSHLATLFKHPKYCLEQETRLVVHLKDSSPIKTRETDAGTVRYWELPFRSHGGPLPIKSITMGPMKCPQDAVRDLRSFLIAHKLADITIRHSGISYEEAASAQPLKGAEKWGEECGDLLTHLV